MDHKIIKAFFSLHPLVFKDWLLKGKGVYQTNLNYELTKKQKKHRLMLKLEKLFGLELIK